MSTSYCKTNDKECEISISACMKQQEKVIIPNTFVGGKKSTASGMVVVTEKKCVKRRTK